MEVGEVHRWHWAASVRLTGLQGAPLANAPFRDDPALGQDKDQANNFDYSVPGTYGPTDVVCPFTCHTRKTAPRNVDPYVDKTVLESALMVRAGLAYGDEVRDDRPPYGS